MLNSSQLARHIDEIYDGVEKSKLGKIVETIAPTQQFPDGKKVNTLPFQTFLTAVSSLLPKEVSGDMKVQE